MVKKRRATLGGMWYLYAWGSTGGGPSFGRIGDVAEIWRFANVIEMLLE